MLLLLGGSPALVRVLLMVTYTDCSLSVDTGSGNDKYKVMYAQ